MVTQFALRLCLVLTYLQKIETVQPKLLIASSYFYENIFFSQSALFTLLAQINLLFVDWNNDMNNIRVCWQKIRLIKLSIYCHLLNITDMQTNLPKQVPFLPGHVFNDPYKQNFHKTQQFVYSDHSQQEKRQNVAEDVDIHLIDELTKTLTGLSFQKERKQPENESIPRIQPPWIKYDRKVLRFYAYFQEHVVESRLENYRIRKVKLYYYLSDETIFITQPKVENSGIPQGVFLKRQKIPKVIGELADHYTWKDFNIGTNISIFDRIFRIYDCDDFTKEFYSYMGVPLASPEVGPDDNFNQFMKTKEAKINPPDTKEYKEYIEVKLGGGHPNDGLKQYLDNDRKVLSFKVLWYDPTLEGGYNYFTLNYFLADSTVEVKEIRFQNSGRDPFPLLLRKQKLPKKPILTHYPGMSLTKQQYYRPEDINIGEHIHVFGRDCVVYDCDDFTKAYYKYKLGIELKPIKISDGQKHAVVHQVPPYNGYGSPEDSLGSVYSLQPKPPKKDMAKIFTNDQFVLRFEARVISESKEDNIRKFIISFFCGDDTVQVYQNADKNSGIWGGKFLERKKHDKQGEQRCIVDTDFQIGGLVKLGAFTFQLLKADDFTIQYMRQRPEKFPETNLNAVINKIKGLSSQHKDYDSFLIWILKSLDPLNAGYLTYDNFYKNISRILKLSHPEAYVVYKQCLCPQRNLLSMKTLFKTLGGS